MQAKSRKRKSQIRFIDGRNRQRSQHIAVVVDDRDDFLPLLVFVAGILNCCSKVLV